MAAGSESEGGTLLLRCQYKASKGTRRLRMNKGAVTSNTHY